MLCGCRGDAYTTAGAVHSVESTESGRLYLYNYDSKGQLIGYTECGKDASGEYTAQLQNFYTYDEMDRIQYWHGSFNYVANGTTYSDAVGYWYEYLDYGDTSSTNIGELDKLSVLEAGINRETTISYEYDEFYRLKEKLLDTAGALSITTGYTFREVSHKTSMLVSSYTSTVSGASGTTVNSYSYTYDVDGNITEVAYGTGEKIIYEYDDLGQLIVEKNEILKKIYQYTYDNGGNRKSVLVHKYENDVIGDEILSEEYTYGNTSWGDQLTKANGVTISYDTIGNPTTFNGYDLAWHGRQLRQMCRNGGQSLLKFMYNADGIRTNKIVDGVNHVYTLNGTQIVSEAWGNFLLIYLYDESGAPIGLQYRTKSYAANVFDTFYFEKNLQGDIIAVYNASGEKIGSYTYDAWGICTVTVESTNTTLENKIVRILNPFRYRGYYYDTETGLYYLQSRYYNPAWGRFLNEDGLIYSQAGLIGYNMYTYCGNNPVMGYDPTGFEDVCVEDFNEDNNPFNDLGHPQGRGGGIGPGTAYHTYTVRCQTAAYDGALGGYHSQGVTQAMVNTSYYVVPGAVTVTDDMANPVTSHPASYSPPPGGGGVTDTWTVEGVRVDFCHGGRHIPKNNIQDVYGKIAYDVIKRPPALKIRGDGFVFVNGTKYDYGYFTRGPGHISVGTIFEE